MLVFLLGFVWFILAFTCNLLLFYHYYSLFKFDKCHIYKCKLREWVAKMEWLMKYSNGFDKWESVCLCVCVGEFKIDCVKLTLKILVCVLDTLSKVQTTRCQSVGCHQWVTVNERVTHNLHFSWSLSYRTVIWSRSRWGLSLSEPKQTHCQQNFHSHGLRVFVNDAERFSTRMRTLNFYCLRFIQNSKLIFFFSLSAIKKIFSIQLLCLNTARVVYKHW